MLSLLAIVVLGALPHHLAAQNAECIAGLDTWSFNSLKQSPCDVAAALAGVCTAGVVPFALQPLSPGFVYLGPELGFSTPCRCSSVYYSLLSACATCQDANFITWTLYKTNCTVVYDQVFPDPIPSNVAVPHYAYLNVDTADNFNITAAASAGGTESTAIPTPTSSNSFSPSIPGATNTSPTFSTSKKSNAGAIAGGVVGGLVALALIAGLVFWLLRRNRTPSAPSSAYDPVLTQTPMTQTPTGMSTNPMSVGSSYPVTPAPRPYDPNDPSTFPTNVNESPAFNPYTSSPQLYPTQVTPNYTGTSAQPSFSRPQYTGAPEVQ